ncbi:MAG: FIST C-terminal domain-containing protein [Planctomycetes bacterium]|nr:FIST C-terminal domain-containing protein [Planctomycetota bacterium]MCH7603390.1 FIST C-terminal domain-containing protein [Planctomycetota bacterium]
MNAPSTIGSKPAAASAISGHLDTRTAGMEVAEQLHDALGGTCDLVVLFVTFHHVAAFEHVADHIRTTLSPRVMMGVTAETVLGGDDELDGLAGLSAIALRLPGANLHPFSFSKDDPLPLKKPDLLPERIGLGPDHRLTLLLADPFSTPITRILPLLTDCGGEQPVILAGGLASGASQAGYNRLLLDDMISPIGGVGVTISGEMDVDFIVSQGCRPIGSPLLVTRAENHLILELGGRKATEVLREVGQNLSDNEKKLLSNGLFIGTVINEYKDHFGRGDFLIRSVLGQDQERGGILAGELGKVGQTVQFQVRDAKTASEDLQLLLDAQQLEKDPFGAMLFTCNGRGQRLFGAPNHDLDMIHARLNHVPTAGFFCAGEIGPIGTQSFLHGHTASLVIFREKTG